MIKKKLPRDLGARTVLSVHGIGHLKNFVSHWFVSTTASRVINNCGEEEEEEDTEKYVFDKLLPLFFFPISPI